MAFLSRSRDFLAGALVGVAVVVVASLFLFMVLAKSPIALAVSEPTLVEQAESDDSSIIDSMVIDSMREVARGVEGADPAALMTIHIVKSIPELCESCNAFTPGFERDGHVYMDESYLESERWGLMLLHELAHALTHGHSHDQVFCDTWVGGVDALEPHNSETVREHIEDWTTYFDCGVGERPGGGS
ncbi:MAG: hypothetical protein WDZ96_02605 [Acidimicrobiia bacterium]